MTNKKFVNKFNEAMKELEGEQFALIEFGHVAMEVFEMFAKNNNVSLDKVVLGMLESYKEVKK